MQGEGPSVRFGQRDFQTLGPVAAQIRTFTEQIQEGDELNAIKNAVKTADRIVFLGFAFHRQNASLLACAIQDHTEILATTLGISVSDRRVIRQELAKSFEIDNEVLFDQRMNMDSVSCVDFLGKTGDP